MVTRDPGAYFDECLAALSAQQYPNFEVLIIDAASTQDPTDRIARALPEAYVKRLPSNPGYGAAANEVTGVVDGAAFYLFLHDDVAPDPTAMGTLVSEALRSNAGIVAPKMVDFDDPRRLLSVGESVDKTGERVSPIEPGELDQEQHDAVRDIFVAPGGAVLIRRDLFDAIGGFDEGIDFLNDDLNISWRAHLAGARVVVAPDATVRHVTGFAERALDTVARRSGIPASRRERMMRHRIRTMLVCYSRWHRIRVVPQAAIVSLLEVIISVLVGRRGQAGEVVRAWRWNHRRRAEIRRMRQEVEAYRTVPDVEIRRLQVRGFARAVNYFRSQQRGGSRSDRAQAAMRRVVDGVRDGTLGWALAAWAVTIVIVGVGSRHLIGQPIPAVGGFLPFDRGPFELIGDYLSGWRDVGLGTESPAPTGLGLLGVAGMAFFGAMGTLRRVMLLGSVILGLIGAFRVVRRTGSVRTQAAALVVYGSIPLAFDAIAAARWDALVVYAATPWLLGQLAAIAGWEPFGPARTDARTRRSQVLRLGLTVAVTSALAPAILVVVAVVVAAMAIGSAITSGVEQVPRLAVAAGGGLVVSALLHLPWALDFLLPGSTWEMIIGNRADSDISLASLLRFDVGPVGGGIVALGLLVAASLPLFIGEGWRFEWAVRAWVLALTSFLLVWADAQGWTPLPLPSPLIMLIPASAALAVAVALGVTAFEVDLPARGFGWRQVLAAIAGVAFLIGSVPTLLDAGNGRWYLPSRGLETTFAFLDAEPDDDFRVLWIGDPAVMPVPGFALGDGLIYATTDGGLPSITDGWPGSADSATGLIAEAIDAARDGDTSRLGRVLAPMAIRFIVLPNAAAPRPGPGIERPAPRDLVDAMTSQLDLEPVLVNPSFTVFRNEAAVAARTTLGVERAGDTIFDVSAGALEAAVAVLDDEVSDTTYRGEVPEGLVLHAVPASDNWSLSVDGADVTATTLYGWADAYEVSAAGAGELSYSTSPFRYLIVLVQGALWAVAIGAYVLSRRESMAPDGAPGPQPPGQQEAS